MCLIGLPSSADRRHCSSRAPDNLGLQIYLRSSDAPKLPSSPTPAVTRRQHELRGRVCRASRPSQPSSANNAPSQVRRIDSQLDRVQLSGAHAETVTAEKHDAHRAARIAQLQRLIKSLSTTNSAKNVLLPPNRIRSILDEANISSGCSTCVQLFEQDDSGGSRSAEVDSSYEHELEWLLLSKATTQAYGSVLSTILEQTIPLEDEIWYWNDILSTYRYAGLYSIQTSPIRLYNWSKEIYYDVRSRGGRLANGWREFYALVKDAAQDRSMREVQRRVVSPLGVVRNEGIRKRATLRRIRLVNANALGVLLGEGLSNESFHEDGLQSPGQYGALDKRHRWKSTVAKSIALMDAVIQNVNDADLSVDKFDDSVAAMTQDDHYYELHEPTGARTASSLRPSDVAIRLNNLLTRALPGYSANFNAAVQANGRPSRIIRYWLPITIGLISSTTVLRIVVNRKEEILTWIREFGQTVIDFWTNWVVEPTKKVIGTIRHDENSEVSIMSKRSLESDRESLERMVVDFAVEHPEGPALNETQIADVRAKVREGDLTPVLRSYEKDLKSPVRGAIMGNLASALLIQVQKTKVDVEVAMSGIDSILKSQELLFGFIGLTPGVLVSIGAYRWLKSVFGNRKALQRAGPRGQPRMILRSVNFSCSNDMCHSACTVSRTLKSRRLHTAETLIASSSVLRQRNTASCPTRTTVFYCARCISFARRPWAYWKGATLTTSSSTWRIWWMCDQA
jgi:nuclear-control-of-ATPase protein 2